MFKDGDGFRLMLCMRRGGRTSLVRSALAELRLNWVIGEPSRLCLHRAVSRTCGPRRVKGM